MKIGYIILAHKNPQQLIRLISRLYNDNSVFIIHIDQKVNINIFQEEILLSKLENIFFLSKRYKANWGGFNLVKAALELIKKSLDFNLDFIVYLSGQSYPLIPNFEFEKYLQLHEGEILMEFEEASLELSPINITNRFYFADFFNYNKTGNFKKEKVPILARMLTKILPKRNFITNYKPFIGRQWFIVPFDVANFIVRQFDDFKRLKNFYRFTISSDEMFFQTLLLNSKFADRVMNVQTTFADYTGANPKVWTVNDFELLKKQNTPFARKFDVNIDSMILDRIDTELLGLKSN